MTPFNQMLLTLNLVAPQAASTAGTAFDRLVDILATDRGLRASIPGEEIAGGLTAADSLNAMIAQGIAATGIGADKRITAAEVQSLNAWFRAAPSRYDQFLALHGDDEDGVETAYHLVQNDGAREAIFGRNLADSIADSLYHIGFQIVAGRFQNEDGNANASVEDMAAWLTYFIADPSTTGSGLDDIVDALVVDRGLSQWTSAQGILSGLAAADSLNRMILDGLAATGALADGRVSAADVTAVNAWVRGDATRYQRFIALHGDDEGGVETGYHQVQNNGARATWMGENLANTIADGLYHIGFEIVDGRFRNEDGDANADIGDVATWLNFLLLGTRAFEGSDRSTLEEATDEAERFHMAGGDDDVKALGGNDTLVLGSGHDWTDAGSGDDTVLGEAGDDWLEGDDGADTLRGGNDNDGLVGGLDVDWMYGDAGNDRLWGQMGADVLMGGLGDDELDGGHGIDRLWGGAGADKLMGGDYGDMLFGDADNDRVAGGNGNDTAHGGTGNDQLYGESGDDVLRAEDGNDRLSGGAGRDLILGGLGNDELAGDADTDWLHGEGGDDTLSGGDGRDLLTGSIGNDRLGGGDAEDSMLGGDGDDTIWADYGNDTVNGGAGIDRLDGSHGNDSLAGGMGNDSLWGYTGRDTLLGGAGDDLLDGHDDNDRMDGGSGADTLYAGSGDDVLHGGFGADRLSASSGDDILVSRSDAGEPLPALGGARILPAFTGASADTLSGSSGADLFRFELTLNTTATVAGRHLNPNGTVNWAGVATENATRHAHWVDGIGADMITDYRHSEGDRISIAGLSVEVASVAFVDTNGDGGKESVITLRSQQGAAGAHDEDLLGTITVFGEQVTLAQIEVDATAVHGAWARPTEAPYALEALVGALPAWPELL
jgi:Ca2+-binding RTX toxin-like protein